MLILGALLLSLHFQTFVSSLVLPQNLRARHDHFRRGILEPLRSNPRDGYDEDGEKVWFVRNPVNGDGKINGYTNPNNDKFAYSAFLERSEPKWMKKIFGNRRAADNIGIDEDGYADDMGDRLSLLKKAVRLPLKGAKSVLRRKPKNQPGTLILVRHGESQWNKNKTFTGWADPGIFF